MCLISLPNSLTILRISLIPIFIVAFYYPWQWHYACVTGIFALAALTDWLDGYLARKLKQVSSVGAFLDPVADKLIVIVALVLLVELHHNFLMSLATVIIICREVTVSALREWMAELGQRVKIAVSMLGKVKTSLQMLAILLLLSQPPVLENKIIMAGYGLLLIAMICSICSMCQYLYVSWRELKNSNT